MFYFCSFSIFWGVTQEYSFGGQVRYETYKCEGSSVLCMQHMDHYAHQPQIRLSLTKFLFVYSFSLPIECHYNCHHDYNYQFYHCYQYYQILVIQQQYSFYQSSLLHYNHFINILTPLILPPLVLLCTKIHFYDGSFRMTTLSNINCIYVDLQLWLCTNIWVAVGLDDGEASCT